MEDDADCWEHIKFQDITVGDCIGGGGVALVYHGRYHKKPVALKTLVRPIFLLQSCLDINSLTWMCAWFSLIRAWMNS